MADQAAVCIHLFDASFVILNLNSYFFFQNLAVLRKCGIPEWVLVDEEWKDFIGFFKDNISEANILTDEELVE